MGKPYTDSTNPIRGAMSEIVSAQSALNMPARAIAEPRGEYLADTDEWAAHAMEHLRQAFQYLLQADKGRG